MKVVVGSKNKTKVGAVEKVWKDAEITSLSVPSGVSAQPSQMKRRCKERLIERSER